MQTATINGSTDRRQAQAAFLDELADEVPGLRIGGTRTRLLSLVAFPLCETIALTRYRSVWREEPAAAVRRTLMLLPVVLVGMAALTVLTFVISPGWTVAAELSIPLMLLGVLVIGPGWVRIADERRAGMSLRALAPLDGRARIALGSFWAFPPGRGHGRRLMNAVLAVADAHGVVVELRASCWQLVREVYGVDGYEPLPDQGRAMMPKLRREPKANVAQRLG
jgi:GNAT superfamily N-acetyltransferase